MWSPFQIPICQYLTDLTAEELRGIALNRIAQQLYVKEQEAQESREREIYLFVHRFRKTYGKKPSQKLLRDKEFRKKVQKDLGVGAHSFMCHQFRRPPKSPPIQYPTWT
jgi:hypothetical protein